MSDFSTNDPSSDRESQRRVGASGEHKRSSRGVSALDIIYLLAKNVKRLVAIPVLTAVIVYGLSYLITPSFTATTRFLPPQQQSTATTMLQSLGALGNLAGAASGLKNPTDQYISFLKSWTVQDAVVGKFQLLERYDEEYKQDARKQLERRTNVIAGKDNIIVLTFEDTDPVFAAQVANGYIEQLGILLNRLAVTEAQQRRQFFQKQLEVTKNDLIKAEQELGASGVSAAVLNATPSTALEGPARLRAQVTAMEVRLATLRGYLTETAPEYRQASRELAALKNELVKAEREQPQSANGKTNDYIAKFRNFKYQETLFELFSRQYELARVDESREGAMIQVVDVAQPPEKKSKPYRALLAAGSGFVMGIMLLVLILLRAAYAKLREDASSAGKLDAIRSAASDAVHRSN